MCIIVAKEKGIDIPSKTTLQTCFENNKDGAGFMYVKNGKVVIDKGYMDFNSFYKRLQKLDRKLHLKDKALVMHFRIGTHGANNKETTHPFPISNDTNDLKKTYFTTDLGMAHNGIIPNYDYEKDLSDTQLFVRDVVAITKHLNKNFYKDKATLDMFKRVTNSKLCFLDTKDNIIYVGDFVKDENGVRYSNNTYKPYSYKCYSWEWDGYDYDYYPSTSKTTTFKLDDKDDDKDFDYDDYEDDVFEDWDKNYINIDVEEFVRKNDYTLLRVGDIVEFNDSSTMEIETNDTYFLTKDFELYEYWDGYVSLIATNVVLLDDWCDYRLRECEI